MLGSDGFLYYFSFFSEKLNNVLFSIDTNGTEMWNLSFGYNLTSGIAMDDNGMLYFSSENQQTPHYSTIYSLFPNGSIRWKYIDNNLRLLSPPSIGPNETIYISHNKGLLSIFQNNGSVKWKFQSSDSKQQPIFPSISREGIIYLGGKAIYALYPNGTIKWKFNGTSYVGYITLDSDEIIYYLGSDIYRAIYPNGTLKWSVKLPGDGINSGIISKNGDIYITTVGGGYYCVIGSSKPTKPIGFNTRSGNKFVNISWLPPSDDGGIGIDGYTLYRGFESGNLTLYRSFDGSTLSYNDTNVTNGKVYFYQVSAFNKMGESDRTYEYSEKPVSIPTPPQGVTVKALGPTIRIEWKPPLDDGGAPILNYLVYKGRSPDSLKYLYSLDPSIHYKNDSFVDWGKVNYYGVTARNRVGESALSEIFGAEVLMPPDTPQNFAAISGDRFVNVSWSPPANDGGRDVVRYELYRGEGMAAERSLIASMGNGSGWFNDTGLVNGVTYRYRLRCNNSLFDSEFTDEVAAVPSKRPSVPSDLNVSFNNGTIYVSWSPPEDTGGLTLMKYELEKWNVDNSSRWTFEVHIGSSFNDTEYERGMTYRYRVRCLNEKGPSGYTDWAEIALPLEFDVPSPPTAAISRSGDGFVHLYWSRPYFDGGTPLLGYRIYRNGTVLIELNNRTMEYNDSGVTNGRTYLYVIVSFNAVGESLRTVELYGHPVKSSGNGGDDPEHKPPSAPVGLSFRKDDWWVVLSWSEPLDAGTSEIKGYNIYRRVGDSGEYARISTVNVTSFRDPEILKVGTYYYMVSAFNSYGEGNMTEALRVEITEKDHTEDTSIWYYIVPAALAIGFVIAITLFLLLKKKNEPTGIVETETIDPKTTEVSSEE